MSGADDVRGVVLAGGTSTRFEDGNKALAVHDDEQLVNVNVTAEFRTLGSQ